MGSKTLYEIKTDTGLSGKVGTTKNLLTATQEELKDALYQYGEWLYNDFREVQFEYRNHWLPKLRKATKFEVRTV